MHSPNSRGLDQSPIIDLENVSFAYPGNLVLRDVSFQVYPGEFIGMIGPNGGGKTTLLKLILNFLKPLKGVIKVFGETAGSSSILHRLAYVPQAVRFDRDFPISVEEVVLSGLISRLPWYGRFRPVDRMAAQEALEKIGLPHLAKASFGTLSGGILFTNNGHKGKALWAYLHQAGIEPRKIVFINDKHSHLLPVEEIADLKGVEFIGLRYGGADARVRSFRKEIADIQHEFYGKILTDEAAEAIWLSRQASKANHSAQ